MESKDLHGSKRQNRRRKLKQKLREIEKLQSIQFHNVRILSTAEINKINQYDVITKELQNMYMNPPKQKRSKIKSITTQNISEETVKITKIPNKLIMNTNYTPINFQKLKQFKKKTIYLVFGYCSQNFKSLTVPIEIINIVVFYHGHRIIFNQKYHGLHIQFINNIIATKYPITSRWSTCILNKEINSSECDKFYLELLCKDCDIKNFVISIGYIQSFYQFYNGINWNQCIGKYDNKVFSAGIYIKSISSECEYRYSLYGLHISRYDDGYFHNKSNYKYYDYVDFDKITHQDNKFGLLFNFINNTMILYSEKNKIKIFSLDNNKKIIPAVSFLRGCGQVEILNIDYQQKNVIDL